MFREAFLAKLQLLLRGTVAAPPERFGETLADEHIRGGAFVGPDNKPVIVNEQLPNSHMRLFGGAQYHRAMAEFRAGGSLAPAATAAGGAAAAAREGEGLLALLPLHKGLDLGTASWPIHSAACWRGLCAQASARSTAPTSPARRLSTPAVSTTSTMASTTLAPPA